MKIKSSFQINFQKILAHPGSGPYFARGLTGTFPRLISYMRTYFNPLRHKSHIKLSKCYYDSSFIPIKRSKALSIEPINGLLPCVKFLSKRNIPYLPVISCLSSNLLEIFKLLLKKYPLNHVSGSGLKDRKPLPYHLNFKNYFTIQPDLMFPAFLAALWLQIHPP